MIDSSCNDDTASWLVAVLDSNYSVLIWVQLYIRSWVEEEEERIQTELRNSTMHKQMRERMCYFNDLCVLPTGTGDFSFLKAVFH